MRKKTRVPTHNVKTRGGKRHNKIPKGFLVHNDFNADWYAAQVFGPRIGISREKAGLLVPDYMPSPYQRLDRLQAEKKLYKEYLLQLRRLPKRVTGFSALWPQSHFSMLICARRYSGKSTLVSKCVKEQWVSWRMDWQTRKLVRSENQFFKKKILISPTAYRDSSIDISSFDEVYTSKQDFEDLMQKYKDARPGQEFESTLIVLDDIHTWLHFNTKSMIHWFITVNRHYDCSLAFLTHNIKGSAPVIRNNASEYVVFRVAVEEELKRMEEAFGAKFEEFYNMVDWSKPFNFLYMTLRLGPKTYFYEGRGGEDDTTEVDPDSLDFNHEDCTMRMRYLGSDVLPPNTTLSPSVIKQFTLDDHPKVKK